MILKLQEDFNICVGRNSDKLWRTTKNNKTDFKIIGKVKEKGKYSIEVV